MKKTLIGFLVVVMSLLASPVFMPGAFAMSGDEKGAWTLDVTHMEDFEGNEPVQSFTGKVTSVEKMPGVSDGVQLKFVSDENAKFTILMGPTWFISNQKVKFMKDDMIDVRGKVVGRNIIATEASKGDWTMRLRNEEDGMPVWQCCFPRNK
jgi:hypothetical protein